jgi:hypothetical protein
MPTIEAEYEFSPVLHSHNDLLGPRGARLLILERFQHGIKPSITNLDTWGREEFP